MATVNMLFAGFGGQGILFAGKFLAYKGLIEGKQVSSVKSAYSAMCLQDNGEIAVSNMSTPA